MLHDMTPPTNRRAGSVMHGDGCGLQGPHRSQRVHQIVAALPCGEPRGHLSVERHTERPIAGRLQAVADEDLTGLNAYEGRSGS